MTLESIRDLRARLDAAGALQVSREDYLDYMTFKRNLPPLFTQLFGIMVGVEQEWIAQGAAPEEVDLSAFPFRMHAPGWMPIRTGYADEAERKVLEETDEYVIWRDRMGRRVKLFKAVASIPLPLDYPVRNMDDWLKVKPHYEFSEARFGENWEAIGREHVALGHVITVNIPGGFNEPRELMGEENLCLAYYEQPELIHDMLATIGDTAFRVLDRVSAAIQVDELSVHEDMAGKSGPLAGPRQIEEFIGPYYRRIWEMLSSRGARLFGQDSDGNLNAVIPAFLDTGLNCMYPMEPAAGMDIVKLRETYGTHLAFHGGIDKHVLRRAQDEIRTELEYKIPPMVASGAAMLSGDHRVTDGTPLENYRFYVATAWEIMIRESEKLGLT